MNNDQLYFYNRGYNDCLAKFIDFNPAKTLTDEEIEQIFENETGFVLNESPMALMDFARAILRKAQE